MKTKIVETQIIRLLRHLENGCGNDSKESVEQQFDIKDK